MAFIPRFKEAGEPEVVENLFAVFHVNMKPALDYYYEDDELPGFELMTEGEDTNFAYPLLVAGIERNSSEDHGEFLKQDLRVGLGLVVKDVSVAAARDRAKKYVRALRAVIWKASPQDLFSGVSDQMEFIVDIEHQYLRHGTNGAEVTQPVEFLLKFRFGEV